MISQLRKRNILLICHYGFHSIILVFLFLIIYQGHPILEERFFSYDRIEERVLAWSKQYPNAKLVGDSYRNHSILSFIHKRLLPYAYTGGRRNHFQYIKEQLPERSDILLLSSRENPTHLLPYFTRINFLETIHTSHKAKSQTTFHLFFGEEYRSQTE